MFVFIMMKGVLFSFLIKILEKKITHFQYEFLRSNNYNFILSFKLIMRASTVFK